MNEISFIYMYSESSRLIQNGENETLVFTIEDIEIEIYNIMGAIKNPL